jgi:hypothetical protein
MPSAFRSEDDAPTSAPAPAAADRLVAALPIIDGEADAAYLSAALARAGRPARVESVETSRLDGGRISANVFSLKSDAGAFVVKKFVPERWRMALFGTPFNEPALWVRGLTRDLPAPLSCPTLDVAFHGARRECWMLMDDVSHGVAPRGSFDASAFRLLLDGLARLHARYWGEGTQTPELPLLTLAQHAAMFTDPSAAAGGRAARGPWVADVLEKVFVFRTYVPVLLDVLGAADGDFYLDLCEHCDRWLAPLTRLPQTVVHGDLRRANIAVLPTGISLFDWDFACRAPAAADLAWYWFLHFWCYPPNDGLAPEDREPLKLYYIERLEEALGGLDRQAFHLAWDLSWLKVFAQIGFCLADPLVGQPTPEDIGRVRALCRKAIDRARRIADAHAGRP